MLSINDLFKGRHFDREIIILCVRWYLVIARAAAMLICARRSGARETDCFAGADGAAAGSLDDGADVGVELGPPRGAEAVGDFAEHDAGAQCALGAVVRRRNVAVRYEDEVMLPRPLDHALEFDASLTGRRNAHEFVEAGVEPRGVDFQGRVCEPFSPPDSAGAAQQMSKLGREDVVRRRRWRIARRALRQAQERCARQT